MNEIPLEILVIKSLAEAASSPENKEMVMDLCKAMNKLFTEQNKPQWCVVSALVMLQEAVRMMASLGVQEMIEQREGRTNNATN